MTQVEHVSVSNAATPKNSKASASTTGGGMKHWNSRRWHETGKIGIDRELARFSIHSIAWSRDTLVANQTSRIGFL